MSARFDVDAVLFDLDGTLLDTIDDLHEAANRMLAELGRPLRSREEVRNFVGKGIPKLVERCLAEPDMGAADFDAAVDVFRRHYRDTNGRRAVPFDTVRDTLDTLKARGFAMGVVTNKARDFTEPLLVATGLADHFGALVCGDMLPNKKPAPDMVLHACAALAVPPQRTLMVGDSANDAECARAAGVPVLLMTYGYTEGVPVDTINCDGLLSRLAELPPLLGC
ncbi:phosphoglycolate phosphatase [Nitrogeniibacter mangrovi]|uniref:Phosphoglycolate phosphatase n=1 Tax=Nitrogeniibacter mangrovi TaxID=2016596 RepID=A0A6C1B0B4_9RHOO|nr:phosphoglycolate phosphatase [Nitrogeniibacter mangrovi]QID17051.1 phosphoglycolate phosphatase [Nitrogeniibacter mangrovi]